MPHRRMLFGELFSDSHSIGTGRRFTQAKRCSTVCTIWSRMPTSRCCRPPVPAIQAVRQITSRLHTLLRHLAAIAPIR